MQSEVPSTTQFFWIFKTSEDVHESQFTNESWEKTKAKAAGDARKTKLTKTFGFFVAEGAAAAVECLSSTTAAAGV